jgi:hypothetical protein
MASFVVIVETVPAGAIVRAVRKTDRQVLAEVGVLRGRECYQKQMQAARRTVKRLAAERG